MTAKKKINWGASRARKPKAAPPPPKPMHTRESLLQAMPQFFAMVDKFMAGPRSYPGEYHNAESTTFGWTYNSPLAKASDGLKALEQQLDEVLRGPKLDGEGPDAEAVVREHFATKPGEPLVWSRPGSILLWVEDIPIRAEWPGFYHRGEGGLFALDSRRLFLASVGYRGFSVYSVAKGCKTPEDYMRGLLQSDMAPRNRTLDGGRPLWPLDQEAREAVQAFRADPANAWWLEAIAKGSSNAISIPLNTPPIQVSLFG